MLVPVGRRVAERDLVAAAQTVVLGIAQQADRRVGVAGHPVLHGGLGAVGRAVVYDDALPHPRGNALIQQLRKHPRDLLFAVISRDKNQQFFHGKLLFCTQFYIIKIIQHRAANRKKKSPLLGKEEAIFAGQDYADLRGRIRVRPYICRSRRPRRPVPVCGAEKHVGLYRHAPFRRGGFHIRPCPLTIPQT